MPTEMKARIIGYCPMGFCTQKQGEKSDIRTYEHNRNKKFTHSQNSMTGEVAFGFVMLVAFSP